MNDGYVGGMKTQDVRLVYRQCEDTECTTGMLAGWKHRTYDRHDSIEGIAKHTTA